MGMSEPNPINTFSHQSLGTTFWIRLAEEDSNFTQRAAEAAFYFLDQLEREMGVGEGVESKGQMGLVNSLPTGEVISVSQSFADLWKASEVFRVESRGAFDVRAGGLIKYWAGRAPNSFNPDDAEWLAAFDRFKESEYRMDGLELHAVKAGASFNFKAILTGYAVDQITEMLESTWGIHRALVMVGSSSARALDPPGEGAGWRMALGPQTEWPLCRSALASTRTGLHDASLIDSRHGVAVAGKGVVRALASTALEAQYLSMMGMILNESEAVRLVGESGQRGLWLANNHRQGACLARPA